MSADNACLQGLCSTYRYHEHLPYIIDVSQAVELDHPQSTEFLRKDLNNIRTYFARQGLPLTSILGLRTSWAFVTGFENAVVFTEGIGDTTPVDILAQWVQEQDPQTLEDDQADAIFLTSHLPRSLHDVADSYDPIPGPAVPVEPSQLSDPLGNEMQDIGTSFPGAHQRGKAEVDSGDEVDDDSDGAAEESEDQASDRPRGFRHEGRDDKRVSIIELQADLTFMTGT